MDGNEGLPLQVGWRTLENHCLPGKPSSATCTEEAEDIRDTLKRATKHINTCINLIIDELSAKQKSAIQNVIKCFKLATD